MNAVFASRISILRDTVDLAFDEPSEAHSALAELEAELHEAWRQANQADEASVLSSQRAYVRAEAAEAEAAKLREQLSELRELARAEIASNPALGIPNYRKGRLARAALGDGVLSAGQSPVVAWLIERGQSENHAPTVWWIAGPTSWSREGEAWTQDALEATRFATREEAEVIISRLFTGLTDASARATEHMWSALGDGA